MKVMRELAVVLASAQNRRVSVRDENNSNNNTTNNNKKKEFTLKMSNVSHYSISRSSTS